MSLLADIEDRFGETESRINAVVQHLERMGSLEQSLDDAGRGLGEASSNIGNLAVSTRTAVESLTGTLDALREAVEVLRRADPARTNEAIATIGTRIEGIDDRTARFESDSKVFRDRLLSELAGTASQLSDESRKTRTTIAAAAESSTKETRKVVENAAVRLSKVFRDRLLSELAGTASQLSDESRKTRTTIAAAAESSTRETRKVVENAAVRLAGQQQDSINGVKLPVYLTLALVLVLVSLQVYSFISA